MPHFRKVSREEARAWKGPPRKYTKRTNVWKFRMFAEITNGDTEGIRRIPQGWRVQIQNGGVPVTAEFDISQYHTLADALGAAVKARDIIRTVLFSHDD